MGDFPQSGRPYGELQSELSGAVDKLNRATDDVVQAAPQPDRLAAKSRHFSQVTILQKPFIFVTDDAANS